MSKSLKTLVATAICMAVASAASAAEDEHSNGILLCNAGPSFARFGTAMGAKFDDMAQMLGTVGCISHLDHKGAVVATTDKGARFERVGGDVKSRLVRVIGADGSVLGHVQYRGYMYPPAQRAAVDAIFAKVTQ